MSERPSDKYHVKQVERCCGTCFHFTRIWEDAFCEHPELCNDVFVDEGFVCDLWKKRGFELKDGATWSKKGDQ